jgi:Zn-dependent protease with chaperone function
MDKPLVKVVGRWSDGKTSAQLDATLLVQPSGECTIVADADQAVKTQGDFGRLNISPRLADISRRLIFEDGTLFETSENDPVDKLMRRFQKRTFQVLLHRIESHWLAVLLSLLVSVGAAGSFVVFGIPAIAVMFANTMPAGVLNTSDQQTLEFMDEFYFQASEIDPTERATLTKKLLADLPDVGVEVKVEFRGSNKMAANAFALPGGTVVFTDDMLALAENFEQIQAVFAHEIGHLAHKHSLRRVAQNSIVAVLVVLATGDATATSDLLSVIPFLLTDLAYSRQFEVEADSYAWQYLSERNIDVQHFARLMARLECSQRSREEQAVVIEAFNNCLLNEEWRSQDTGRQWSDYLRSHPPSVDRITRFLP